MSHGTADTSDAVGVPDRPNGDRQVSTRRGGHGDVPERMWAYDLTRSGESPEADDLAADLVAGPTRHRSIRRALRRRTWLWSLTTVLGLLIGLGLFAKHPPGYQASTSVVLAYGPDQNIGAASATDLSLAQSRTVAEETLQRLGLQETLAGFIGSYSVTAVTDRVLQFTVTAPTSDEAVLRANVLAAEFLQFRAALLENQQQFVFAALNSELAHATPAALPGLQAAVATYRANTLVDTTSAVNGSKVLNVAAPIHRSLKKVVTYPGGGLLAGLGVGMGIIIVETLVSDRPRRRDDVARALGAPVRFSVGKVRRRRWLPARPRLAAARRVEIRWIADYLRTALRPGTGGSTALAVVPVGDPRVAALSVVSLAQSCAQQGLKVVLADLCRGAPAARLLRAKAPGVHEVNVDGVPLTVTVPDRDDPIPAGPLGRGLPRSRPEDHGRTPDPLAVACEQADLLLTLADLDPALGAEHLPEWATDVVVMVTAGRSSSAKIRTVGEMIRLAGLSPVSGVLVGADKTDESLGINPSPDVADMATPAQQRTSRSPAGA
jgi:capsular polysaccharide biosynthesis protein